MATCYRCKDMKKGRRRFCRHTRPRPCTCATMAFPHRVGSKAYGWGVCERHPNFPELIEAHLKLRWRKQRVA